MTEGDEIHTRIEQAAQARRDQQALRLRLETATEQVQQHDQRVVGLRAKLDDENEDVEKLESFSLGRIWATLKGSRDTDLDREAAERDAARYAVAEAEARRDVARRDAGSLSEQLRALGDVDAMYAAALDAKQQWVQAHDAATAEKLADIADERGRLGAEDREAREAHAAGLAAIDRLDRARQLLGSAESWSTWDTFGGGGMFTDMVKYDKLDKAAAVLREADLALGRFSRELADLGVAGVQGVQVDALTTTFDVFFDNIFSDLAVRSRIREGAARVDQARAAVGQVLERLAARGKQIAHRVRELDESRQRLLVEG